MKRRLITLNLLLFAGLVSTGTGVALADSPDQNFQTTGYMTVPDTPPFDGPGPEFECQGDPDDAITGNRYSGSLEIDDDSDDESDLPFLPNMDMGAGNFILELLFMTWGPGSM